MRNLVLVAVAAATACAGTTEAPPEVPRGSTKEAKKEVRGLVEEAYDGLRTGDVSGQMALFAKDLFVVGAGPTDLMLDRSAALDLGGQLIDSKKKHRLKSFGLEVFGGPDGHSGYAIDQIEFDGTAFAITVIASEVDDLWAINTVFISRALSAKRLDTAAVLDDLPRWRPEDDDESSHRAAPREMTEALALAASDVEARLTQYGKDPDAAYVGPSPDEVLLGAKAIGKKWKKRAPTWEVEASIAGATADGGLVWLVANAHEVAPAKDKDDRDDRDDRRRRKPRDDDDDRDKKPPPDDDRAGPPRRLFAIYRDDGGEAGWGLALLHAAVAVAH